MTCRMLSMYARTVSTCYLGFICVFVTFLFLVEVATGLQCLYCAESIQPTECDTVMTCGPHEVCYVETHMSGTGRIRYKMGCRDINQCASQSTNGKRMEYTARHTETRRETLNKATNVSPINVFSDQTRRSDTPVCSECCATTLCNAAGCGSHGYPSQRGPVCFNCQYQTSTDDCDKITLCGRDEACKLISTNEPVMHQTRYQTGCENEVRCKEAIDKLQQTSAVIVGKRSIREIHYNESSCFMECCKSDLCNSNCNSTSQPLFQSSSTSVLTSPVTSYLSTTTPTEFCLSNPCQRGTCSEYHNTYKCTCVLGFWGRNCEFGSEVHTAAPYQHASTSFIQPDSGSTSAVPLLQSTHAHVLCQSSWSTWLNKDSPNTGDGDREFLTKEEQQAFCPGGKITRIECVTTYGIASYSTGEIRLCTIEGGSVCLNSDNAPIPCSDYKIRYFCTCSEVPTQHPPVVTNPTTAVYPVATTTIRAPPCLQSRWSKWINRDHPDSGDGDIEHMTSEELGVFCAGGRVSAIECQTSDGIPSYSTGENLSCAINNGLECVNLNNYPISCSDYKVRYYCECAAPPTLHTTTNAPALANHNTAIPVTETPCIPEQCPPIDIPIVKEGDVLRMVSDDRGCCMRYEVFCKPEMCTPPTLVCPPPMNIQPANLDDCCPIYKCMCPTICPTINRPHCETGMEAVEINAVCNCTQIACLSKPLATPSPAPPKTCRYTASMAVVNGTSQHLLTPVEQTYQIGNTWSDGLCRQCFCEERSGSAEISCHEETCPVCPMGSKSVAKPGQCCGECH